MTDVFDQNPPSPPSTPALPLPVHLPHTAAARRGWDWIREGFTLFMRTPGVWVGITVVGLLIQIVLSAIPIVNIVVNLLMPVWIGGLALGCHAQASGEPLRLNHLFAGFGPKLKPLLLCGVIVIVLELLIFAVVLGSTLWELALQGTNDVSPEFGVGLLLRLLIALALIVPVYAASWFAPLLIMLSDLDVVSALKQSLAGCLKNITSLLVYGLVLIPLGILAALPFGLGMLVLAPVLVTSLYLSYREIFID
ncbi:MAG TPA: BPSS1780 family membrane protein [Hyphomicrobiales bacterium]|nr:BPSS1780 family membrane protein [Hyphomicrobiales bacterium]